MELCLPDEHIWTNMEVNNFLQFIVDLLHHILETVGLHWQWVTRINCAQVHFTPFIGDTILHHRNCYDEEFRKRIRKQLPKDLLKPISIELYVENYIRDCFENHPAAEIHEKFFIFCTFLADLAIFCFRYHKSDLIERIVFSVTILYNNYMAQNMGTCFWDNFNMLAQNIERISKGFVPTRPKKRCSRHRRLIVILHDKGGD